MLEFISKLLPCFSSPQQSEGVFVREGFTTVPEIKPTTSVPHSGGHHGHGGVSTGIDSSLAGRREVAPIERERALPVDFSVTSPPALVEDDSAEGDENWEDWKAPETTTTTVSNSSVTIPASMSVNPSRSTGLEFGSTKLGAQEVDPIALSLPPIESLPITSLSLSRKEKEKEKEKEEEKAAEPEVDWFSDMTPTYKPPPRLVAEKKPSTSAPSSTKTSPVISSTGSASASVSPVVNRLSLASLEMDPEEIDDDGWIEEDAELSEEKSAAPTKVSRLEAMKNKKKEQKTGRKTGKKTTSEEEEL